MTTYSCKLCGVPTPCEKHGAHGYRSIKVTRELPVAELTPLECQELLVHTHHPDKMRRKAYLFVAEPAITGNKDGRSIYFTPEVVEEIKHWIICEAELHKIRNTPPTPWPDFTILFNQDAENEHDYDF